MANIILAATDIAHRDSCNAILAEARLLAAAKQAELHICYVLPYGHYSYIHPYIPSEVVEDTARRARADLDELSVSPVLDGMVAHPHLLQGGVYQQLLSLAKELDPDTIVINAAIDNNFGAQMGSVTSRVARYAECKVMIVR